MAGSADPGVMEELITRGSSESSGLSVFTDCLEICAIAHMYGGGCSLCSSNKMRCFVFPKLIGLFISRGSDRSVLMCLKTKVPVLPSSFSFP